ncbi:MAG: hypothetical protein ACR2RL_15225, partial [Gammaproteobacteria bacterium]
TARHWGDLRLDTWAGDFNGSTWFAASRDTLYAFDLHKERPEAYWRVSELGGEAARIQVLRRHASRLHLIVGGDELERWTYELPDIVLRERASIKGTDGALFAVEYSMHDLGPDGHVLGAEPLEDGGALMLEVSTPDAGPWRLALDGRGLAGPPMLSQAHVVVPIQTDEGSALLVEPIGGVTEPVRIELAGTRHPRLRVHNNRLLIHGQVGRVTVFDLASATLMRSLRV